MSRVNLKRLIGKREISSIIRDCVALSDSPIALWDANSNLLLGRAREDYTQRYPVKRNGEVIGWVDGDDKASLLASLISFAAMTEYEKRALSRETLNKYRELIHLHDSTEQIARSLAPEEVARVAIDQAIQSISATGASIMVYSEEQNALDVVAAYGDQYHPKMIMKDQAGIAAVVMKTGKAEIINDVYSDPRYVKGINEAHSLMCAPLKSKGKTIGIFNISSNEPHSYLAEDLNLLQSIAAQTATALTNAQFFEQLRVYSEELENKNMQLQKEIIQRKQSEKALMASEEKYRLHFENVLDVIYSVDADFKIVTMSPSVEKIVGYAPEELIGRPFPELNLLTEDSLKRALADTMRSLGGEKIDSAEYEFIAKDGSIKTGEVSSAPLFIKGKIVSIFSVARDITERVQNRQALVESEERFRKMAENINDGLIIMEEGKTVYVNKSACEITGYSKAELMSMWFPALVASEEEEKREKIIEETKSTGVFPGAFDIWIKRKDGTRCCINLRFSATSKPGVTANAYAMFTDITEKKKAEETLRATTTFLDNIIESSLDCIIVGDDKGTLDRVNRYFLALLGYEAEDVIGRHMSEFTATEKGTYDLITGVSIEITQEYIDKQMQMVALLRDEKRVSNWESYLIHKDGHLIPTEVNINYLYDEHGERTGSVGILRDITERKTIEKEITETRDFLENLIDNSLDFVIIADAKGYIRRVNKQYVQSLGVELEELRGKHMSQCAPTTIGNYELVSGEGIHITQEFHDSQVAMIDTLLKEKSVANWESFYCRRDGKLMPVEQNLFYLFNESGEIMASVGIVRDITERRKAEREIKGTRDSLDNIIESSQDCIITTDADGYLTRVNKYFLEILGYREDEVLGRHTSEFAPQRGSTFESTTGEVITVDEEFYNNAMTKMQQLVQEGHIANWDFYLVGKNKKIIPVEENLVYLYDENRNKVGAVGILRNITERKKAEMQVKETRDFLQDVITTSLDGIIVTDALSTITMVNNAAVDILGYSREELFRHRIQGFLEVGGEVEERGKQIQKILMEKGSVYAYEHKWRTKNGTFVDVEMSIALLKDRNRDNAGAVVSIKDITDRKQAEKKILDYQNQLRSMASQLTLTEEQERRNIATDLHDRIGQTLAIAKIKLGALRASTAPLGFDKDVDEIRDLVEQSIQDTRSLIFDLCPPFLYELGFEKALEWLLEDIQEQYGIATHFECDGKPYQLDDDLRILLYQSVRELFINIVKHAQAEHARLSVQSDPAGLQLCIEDDGRGFDEPTSAFRFDKEGGFGLFRIQERFHFLGGEITIDSKPQQGTRISLLLPFKSSEHTYKEDVQ